MISVRDICIQFQIPLPRVEDCATMEALRAYIGRQIALRDNATNKDS